jgi:4-amino-4-deoxy-L-arabinose transferase-like glycosyltransferase
MAETDQAKINQRLDILTLVLLGLVVALGAVLRWRWIQQVDTQPVADFHWYFERAKELVKGDGYAVDGEPTSYWPVGYPLALSGLFSLTGVSLNAAKILNLLLTLSAVPLTFLLSLRLIGSRTAALIAATLIAVHPSFVAYSSILASEPLFVALILTGSLVLLKARGSVKLLVLGGLIFGAAVLVRPQAVLLPMLVLLAGWWGDAEPKQAFRYWKSAGITMAALLVLLTPWLIRTSSLYGGFVFVSTNGGDNLLIGNHEGATGRYKNPKLCGVDFDPDLNELERDKVARAAGVAYIKAHPLRTMRSWPKKLNATFLSLSDASYWAYQKSGGAITVPGMGDDKAEFKGFRKYCSDWSLPFFIAAILGIALGLAARLRLKRGEFFPLTPTLVIGVSVLLTCIFFGNPRFGFPAIPMMAIYIGAIPFALVSLIKGSRSQSQ